MTTPDSTSSGGVHGSQAGGLAAGVGDDAGEGAVTREAEQGRSRSSPAAGKGSSANGGLAAGGGTGPDLTADDAATAAGRAGP